jgi:hypothetical protein
MIKQILGIVISASLVITPVTAHADEPVTDNLSELELVVTLQKDSPAPFTGTLFSTAAAAKLLAELELNDTQCKIAIEREVDLVSARYELDISNLNARIESLDQAYSQRLEIKEGHINFLDQQLIKASKPRNELWLAAGIVSGVVLTGVAAWSMGQVNHTH